MPRVSFLHWFWLGLISFLSIPYLIFYEQNLFNNSEPFYSLPIESQIKQISLRRDTFGKGFFGAKRNGGRIHAGIDIAAPMGNFVLASKSGRVFVAGIEEKGYGNYVELHHPDGLLTRYAHLSQTNRREGQWVVQGEVIGRVGKSGNADHPRIVPHLHYEIRFKEHPLNPLKNLLDPAIKIEPSSSKLGPH